MQQVINFVIEYWRDIVAALIMVISFVIWLIKKKPVYNEMDNILLSVLKMIPFFINSSENTSLDGLAKKAVVMESIKSYCKKQFSFILSDGLYNFFDEYVELVLSTPHKKEVVVNEKRK